MRFNDEGYFIGAPEMIFEIEGSSASFDFCEMRDIYEQAGVDEYLVFETIERRIALWQLKSGQFPEIQPKNAIYTSVLFPGLWLDADAVRSLSSLKLIQTFQHGIKSV